MPTITLTLADTPDGGVSIHSSFKPAVGHPCSPAQGYALEIINRTHRQWARVLPAIDTAGGVDIGAVHRARDESARQALETLQQRETQRRKAAADKCVREWAKK